MATATPFANADDVIVFTEDTPVHSEVGQSVTARQFTARQAAAAEATARRAATGQTGALPSAGISKEELALDGHKVYEVRAPAGRHHDSLWAIAERHLGDGRRYQEIYRLNEGRPQPDGRTLHLARLIQPGWRLVMPEDAIGVPRYVAERSVLTPEPDESEAAPPSKKPAQALPSGAPSAQAVPSGAPSAHASRSAHAAPSAQATWAVANNGKQEASWRPSGASSQGRT